MPNSTQLVLRRFRKKKFKTIVHFVFCINCIIHILYFCIFSIFCIFCYFVHSLIHKIRVFLCFCISQLIKGHVTFVQIHRAYLFTLLFNLFSSKMVWRNLGMPIRMCKFIFLRRYVCQFGVALKTSKRLPLLCIYGINYRR